MDAAYPKQGGEVRAEGLKMNRAVAIAAVAGMAVGAGAVIAVRPAAVVKSRVEKAASPVEKVANCEWWSKRLAEDQVTAIAKQIASTNSGNVIWIDDTGACGVIPLRRYSGIDRSMWVHAADVNIGKRRFPVVVNGAKRPTIDDAMSDLLSAVEAAEFRDGPGR